LRHLAKYQRIFPASFNSLCTALSLVICLLITVINHILVNVQPGSVIVNPLGVQGFTASVLEATNQGVVWQVQGTDCAGVLCGSIAPPGAYTAPPIPPSPNAVQIVAISQDDSSQMGAANVSISTGANILSLLPASVDAGAANGFTIHVTGSGFVPSSPGPGSALLIGGTARVTNCHTANSCSAPANFTDVAQAGNVAILVQNPSGTKSNVVSLVVVPLGTSEDVITLSSAAPSATGKDISVVESSTAGLNSEDVSLDLQVAAIGTYVTASNTCNLAGNPIHLNRPASGSVSADICLFSQAGFDANMSYTISSSGDVAVIAKQPAGLGVIHLTLQIPATAAPGTRKLFIQNTKWIAPQPQVFWRFNEHSFGRSKVSYTQRRNFLWVLFAIGMILIAIVANATTLVHLPFQQLVGYSSAIARVQCVGSDVRLENGEIWTDTRFHVLETVKGFLPGTIVVRQPGGKFQNLHSHVDGSPEFRPDEEVYLFLIGKPGKQFNVVGWSQGTFRIRRDTCTGVETVTQDSAEIPVYDPESQGFKKTGFKNVRVDAFVENIHRETMRPPS
jgi:hypothetical protein